MAINPFFNAERRLRNGWWIALFFLLMAAMLVPRIILAQRDGEKVPPLEQGAILAVASLSCQLLRRRPLAEMVGQFNWQWPKLFGLGSLLGAALMLAPALLLRAFGVVEWRMGSMSISLLLPTVALVAGGALIEELMFRGFVFQRVIDGLGEWPAQLILGGLFLLTHADALHVAGGQRFMAGANIFLASVMFGLAFIRTRSLAMPLGLHFAANFVQGSVLGFGVSGRDQPSLAVPVFGSSPDWLTGGAFGLEASAPGLVSVIVSVIILLRWKPATRSASPARGAK